MINKPIKEISKEDIKQLVADEVREGRALEYKERLPDNSDKRSKQKFLDQVSALANASGGDLVFGISERKDENTNTGIAGGCPGLDVANTDLEENRLVQLIRTGIDPRIIGIDLQWVPGFEKGPVLVVRVPNSWQAPHMVILNGLSKFFTRTSAGIHQLDVGEPGFDTKRHTRGEKFNDIKAGMPKIGKTHRYTKWCFWLDWGRRYMLIT
jgi:predicted HTH transcriptional regulator